MESVATEPEIEIAVANVASTNRERGDEILCQIRNYLLAWRLGDEDWLAESSNEILKSTQRRAADEPETTPIQIAIEEADSFLGRWLAQHGPADLKDDENAAAVSLQQRVVLLFGAPPGIDMQFSDSTHVAAALHQGESNAARAYNVSRPPETRAMNMKTSLSALPSKRLIGGWILLIGLLFFAFFLTH